MNIDLLKNEILQLYNDEKKLGKPISEIFDVIFNNIENYNFSVSDKVIISEYILNLISEAERLELCKNLLEEQIINQRKKLEKWSLITAQSSQIDTGYIAQHLVSLRTCIPGQDRKSVV